MRRHTNGTNNSALIEQAIATLVNNQAAFVAQLNENNKIRAEADLLSAQTRKEADLRWKEADLRFSRIEKELEEIKAILHQLLPDILAKLPEAVSRKIGFKPK
jgi:uncharacterized protein (DUF2236 family)